MPQLTPFDHPRHSRIPTPSPQSSANSAKNQNLSQQSQTRASFGNFQASPQQLSQPQAQVLGPLMATPKVSQNVSSPDGSGKEDRFSQSWRNMSGHGIRPQETMDNTHSEPDSARGKDDSITQLPSSWQEMTPEQRRENWVRNRKRRQRQWKDIEQDFGAQPGCGRDQNHEDEESSEDEPSEAEDPSHRHSRQSSSIDLDKAFQEWGDKNRDLQHAYPQYSSSPSPEPLSPPSSLSTPTQTRRHTDKPLLQRQAVIRSHVRRVSREAPHPSATSAPSQQQPPNVSVAAAEDRKRQDKQMEQQKVQPQCASSHAWTGPSTQRHNATLSAREPQEQAPRAGGRGTGTLWDHRRDSITPGRRQGALYEPGEYAPSSSPRHSAATTAAKSISRQRDSASAFSVRDNNPTPESAPTRLEELSAVLSRLLNKMATGGVRNDRPRNDGESRIAATSTPPHDSHSGGDDSPGLSDELTDALSSAFIPTAVATTTTGASPTPAVVIADARSSNLVAPKPMRFPVHATLPPIESTRLVQPPPGFSGLLPRRIVISPMPEDPVQATSTVWGAEYGVAADNGSQESYDRTVFGRRGSDFSSTMPASFDPVVGSGRPGRSAH